jgi:predicted component of type VI protein secretion system
MRATKLVSTHDVSIHKRTSQGGTLKLDPVTARFERVRWTTKNHPEALWSPEEAPGTAPGGMIKGVPAGVLVRARRTLPEHRLGPFNSRVFAEELIPKTIALSDQLPPSRAPAADLAAALAGGASLQSRVRDHLARRRSGWNTGACTVTGAKLAEIFQAPPQCAALGSPL